MSQLFFILLAALAITVAVVTVVYIVVPVFRGVGWLIRHVFHFIRAMIGEILRAIGAVITALVLIPLVLGNIVIGRWSAAAHFGRSFQNELYVLDHCACRFFVKHPARLLGLTALTEGLEKRLPEAMAKAPGADKPSRRTGRFEGYTIVGSLPGGGSGAKLYVAEPDQRKAAAFARAGHDDVEQVIIKAFSLGDGSTLPQIIRESRALEAAKEIGLVLEHELTDQRFHYVMPYVPGDDLGAVTRRLHDAAGAEGLDRPRLAEALSHITDLVRTLERYHRAGLWHKDVKPDNIIVHNGRAHLVDLGLVTPMRSAMTLTTHGTEYFRDPEMVRMALKGVKVHEVDGAKFDIYAAGAVLYSVMENSFPAHGGLSQVTKRCPDAARWIIRRAMSDYNSRYTSAAEMLADLNVVVSADDPFAVKPADLPSMQGAGAEQVAAAAASAEPLADRGAGARAGSPRPPASPAPAAEPAPAPSVSSLGSPPPRRRPRLSVTDWWTGRYVVRDAPRARAANPSDQESAVRRTPRPHPPAGSRRPAHEQLRSAQARARTAQQRAAQRMSRNSQQRYDNSPNFGVALAVLIFLVVLVAGGMKIMRNLDGPASGQRASVTAGAPATPEAPSPPSEASNTHTHVAVNAPTLHNGAEARLLVLDDLHHADERTRRAMRDALRRLREQGFGLIGVNGSEQDRRLLAEARAALGPPPPVPDDPDYIRNAQAWLEQQPERIKGVLRLVWRKDDQDRRPDIHLLAARDLNSDRSLERSLRIQTSETANDR